MAIVDVDLDPGAFEGSDKAVVAGALSAVDAGLATLLDADLSCLSDEDLGKVVATTEVLARRFAAAQVDVLDAVDRTQAYRRDGHFNAKNMVRHEGRLAGARASGRQKSMRMMRDLSDVRDAFWEGRIGVDQVELLARVWSNVRVRDLMNGAQSRFLGWARKSYRDFEIEVRTWESLLDDDGPEPDDAEFRKRDARLVEEHFARAWKLDGRFGALDGADMREVHDHYIEAELLADWEAARAEHGDAATEADLPRTPAQRRADALVRIFRDAAATPGSPVPADRTHTIVWSEETFFEMTRRLDGEEPRPFDPDTYRCETLDGTPLDPNEAIVDALTSQIRRAVVNAAGVTIDLGEKRLFTGSARAAAKLASETCYWPGCDRPVSRCEIDHLEPHAAGGKTRQRNAGPCCGGHNRIKERGFRVWRDPTGEWRILRPDGTELTG